VKSPDSSGYIFTVSKATNCNAFPFTVDVNVVPFSTGIELGSSPVVLNDNLMIASEEVTELGVYPIVFA